MLRQRLSAGRDCEERRLDRRLPHRGSHRYGDYLQEMERTQRFQLRDGQVARLCHQLPKWKKGYIQRNGKPL